MKKKSQIINSFIISFIALLFLACAETKTTSSVFPDSNPKKVDACSANKMEQQFIVQWEDGSFSIENDENADSFAKNFVDPNLEMIKFVEKDQIIKLPQPPTNNDLKDLNDLEEHFDVKSSAEEKKEWGQQIIEAPALWEKGVTGEGILIGVVDAAVDYHHPQIFPQLAINKLEKDGIPNFDDDGNGYIDDIYGWDFFASQPEPHFSPDSENMHGTHVAGIMIANPNYGEMHGVAPGAHIVPANFMDETGSGTLGSVIKALKYVASRKVNIINASWGGRNCSKLLKETIAQLASQNILFVSASGNDHADLDSNPDFPAAFNFNHQITVAASRSNDKLADFSNTSYNFVHLAAPGDGIFSTVPYPIGYASASGTSMAAPFVSGSAALLWSFKPQATFEQIKEALISSVEVLDYRVQSRGRLNVRRALQKLR